MKKLLLIISAAMVFACNNKTMEQKKLSLLAVPETRRDSTVDDYFGTKIADPYRWLENDTAGDVIQWVKDQNKYTHYYLDQIPYREQIKKRLTEIWNFPRYSSPFKEGDFYYFSKNDGLQNQSILYRTTDLNQTENAEVFIDPNKLSNDGTVSLASLSFSKDHQHAAVGIAKSGSDWNQIFVINVKTKEKTGDTINWVKFSAATWRGAGFYYSRYDEPAAGKDFSNQNQFMKIYYHRLGQPQITDQLIFEDKAHPLRYFNASLSEDERFLFINVSEGTSGSEVLCKDLGSPKMQMHDFTMLFKGFKNNYSIVNNDGDRILALTDYDAPRYRLISVDPKNPDPKNWTEVIPQSKDLLESVVSAGGDQLIATFLSDASSRLKQYTYKGAFIKAIELPGIGTVATSGCKKEEHKLAYNYVSFTDPGSIFLYDLKTQTAKLWKSTAGEAKFNPADFETKQVFYPSKDGTKIPMFIISKKGTTLDGNNPTLLYAYGGFNISITPSFSVSRIMFLERGGVYAIANLRGGGEYGEDWHKAGMLDKKQNVFDDFISAAEYLISEKYTNSKKLAINGGSNGGLLIGACMTQRPELFRVAIPAVGVLDMLRYHKFTIGHGWAVEYGSSDNKEQFDYLLKYSPLHQVKDNMSYPATMIMTADHDDRVVPAHSFKFAATLLSKPVDVLKPILIRIDTKAGHGAGKPTTKLIEDAADMYSFILWNLGVAAIK